MLKFFLGREVIFLDQEKLVKISWSSQKMKLDQGKLAPVTASRKEQCLY